ncbi:MAG: MarR family transcriptional regulator [Nocardioides sp.]
MPADDRSLEELSSDLVVYAARLVRAVRRLHEQPAGVRVLALLDELGPLSIGALARADRCSQPTMSLAVARLMESDDVHKQADPDDARATAVTLTPSGRRTLAETRRVNGALVAARVAEHDTHSRHDLATAVAVLSDLVDLVPTTSEKATL